MAEKTYKIAYRPKDGGPVWTHRLSLPYKLAAVFVRVQNRLYPHSFHWIVIP